jgi:ABC-type branched-subunit amino acid transport system substrate-binding protein
MIQHGIHRQPPRLGATQPARLLGHKRKAGTVLRKLPYSALQLCHIPCQQGRALLALTASLILLSLLPARAHAASNVLVIGQAIDLSGPNAAIGRDYVAGIKTCLDAANAAGGINGRRIQYIVRDDHGDPAQSAKLAAELLERDQADYLLGGVGNAALRAIAEAPAFKRSGQTLYAPLAAPDDDNGTKALFWRPAYKQEIRYIFAHFSKLGIDQVGVAYQDTATHAEAYRAVLAEIRDRRMKLSSTAKIGAPGDSSAGETAKLAATKPGFVIVVADTIGTALFLKEYRKHDRQTFVAGTSLTNLDTLRELAGSQAVEWTVFSQVVPNPAGTASLLQIEHLNMMRKYRDEAVSSMTLEGYAAAKALIKALQAGGTKRSLHDLFAQRDFDLGGLMVSAGGGNRLSGYLDIALYKKGGGLAF